MVGRSHFQHRLALVGTLREIEDALDEYLAQKDKIIPKVNRGVQQFFHSSTSTAKVSRSNNYPFFLLLFPASIYVF
jgi:hypothetical protein